MSGGLTLCNYVVSRRRLPLFVAAIGSVYALASVLGPILGGAFAESPLTWRFCFWINLRKFLGAYDFFFFRGSLRHEGFQGAPIGDQVLICP